MGFDLAREEKRGGPADVRPVSRPAPVRVRRRMVVGAADDRSERDADATAARVIDILRSAGLPEGGDGAGRLVESRIRRSSHAVDGGPASVSGGGLRRDTRIRRATALGNPVEGTIGRRGGDLGEREENALHRARRSGGQPLGDRTRSRMEAAFGSSFRDVRVHAGSTAQALAADMHAEAFTIGSDVFIGHDAPGEGTSGGDELFAHELTHVLQARAGDDTARRTIRRKGTHFLTYASTNIPNFFARCAAEVPMKEALIQAWMLDQNIYEMVDLFGGNMFNPELEYVAFLQKAGLTVADVVGYVNGLGAPPKSAGDDAIVAFLGKVVKQIPIALTQTISKEKQATKGNAATSQITWGGLTAWGAGTSVELLMMPGGLPAGSGPNSDPTWMKTVEQHHPYSNNTTLYVRGHLLNDNIGGPGLDYNMVPITGKPAKNVGANDANGEHLHAIEVAAKDMWTAVRLGKALTATYTVTAQYGRGSRAETASVRTAEQKFRANLEKARSVIEQALLNLPLLQQQAEIAKVEVPKMGVGMPAIGPQVILQMVAMRRTTEAEREKVVTLIASANPLMTAITNDVGVDLLNASADGDYTSLTLNELYSRVVGNAETWEAEDRYIPLSLLCTLQWTEPDGTVKNLAPPAVPVTLSGDVDKVYFRPWTKTELKKL